MRKLPFFVLLAAVLALSACSSGNSDAPTDTEVHPQSWFSAHADVALADPGYSECTDCHGTDFQGSGDVVSCYSCHSYNTEPPFTYHPPTWSDPYINHRGYASAEGTESCANCHGQDLKGRPPAPSCFSASFDGQSCHADGPGQAPHPVDGTYLLGSNHGPDAKADLTACQQCHGQPGGPGSNPRFNVGISSEGGNGCESCHGAEYAHPANWAGPNTTFHYTAGNIQNACTLCHGVNLDGADGVGVSCLECHSDAVSFALDCSACHAYPPLGSPDDAAPVPVNHRSAADIGSHDVCVACHGMKESTAGGSFSPASNYTLFDAATETNGDHWNGKIEMNSAPQYNPANFGCDAAGCHGNNPAHQLSDSGLPVNLKDFGASGLAPHPLDGSYIFGTNHGPDAKASLKICQACHAQPGGPGSNPRFNVGITGTGCEICHGVNMAHPVNWAGPNNTFHYSAGDIENSCTLCHGVNLDGLGTPTPVGVSCLSCHAEVSTFALDCSSCHGYPPDGTTPEPPVAALNGQLVDHGGVTDVASHDQCAICHGVKSSNTANNGALAPNANYLLFNPLTETNGDHWNGRTNMNGPTPTTGAGYNQTNYGCDNAGCHFNDTDHRLSDSALTVQFGDYGSGGATHALDGSFLAPSAHGTTAKADLASCKTCHGEGTTTNPRYNLLISIAGGNGCEGCHNDQTAHPSQGTREAVNWYDVNYSHNDVASATFATACGLCHPGLGGAGNVGPACTLCHVSNPAISSSGCVSCHANPPNGTEAPNRSGEHRNDGVEAHPHDNFACNICHTNNGPGSAGHFTRPATAGDFSRADLLPVSSAGNMNITIGPSNVSCAGSCHSSRSWY